MAETVSNAIIIWRGTFEGGTTFNSADNKVDNNLFAHFRIRVSRRIEYLQSLILRATSRTRYHATADFVRAHRYLR